MKAAQGSPPRYPTPRKPRTFRYVNLVGNPGGVNPGNSGKILVDSGSVKVVERNPSSALLFRFGDPGGVKPGKFGENPG